MQNRVKEINKELEVLRPKMEKLRKEIVEKDNDLEETFITLIKGISKHDYIDIRYNLIPLLTLNDYDRMDVNVSLDNTFDYMVSMSFSLYIYVDRVEFNVGTRGRSDTNSAFYKCLQVLVSVMDNQNKIREFMVNTKDHRNIKRQYQDIFRSIEYLEAELRHIEKEENSQKAMEQIAPGNTFDYDGGGGFKITRLTKKMVYYHNLFKTIKGVEYEDDYECYTKIETLLTQIINGTVRRREGK